MEGSMSCSTLLRHHQRESDIKRLIRKVPCLYAEGLWAYGYFCWGTHRHAHTHTHTGSLNNICVSVVCIGSLGNEYFCLGTVTTGPALKGGGESLPVGGYISAGV